MGTIDDPMAGQDRLDDLLERIPATVPLAALAAVCVVALRLLRER